MIEAKQAVQIAKLKAAEILEQAPYKLEEIERERYNGDESWSITLSFPRDLDKLAPLGRMTALPLEYKRFLIDAETGELLAVKIREFAAK